MSSSCSTSAQLSTALKDAQFGCSHVSLYGQQTGAPMAHRMGIYKKMAGNMHSGHPTYVFKSHQFGLAYLYYENLTPSEEYWVVGPTIGSRDANLGVSDKAMSADKITGVWHVADVAKGTFDMAPSIFIECDREYGAPAGHSSGQSRHGDTRAHGRARAGRAGDKSKHEIVMYGFSLLGFAILGGGVFKMYSQKSKHDATGSTRKYRSVTQNPEEMTERT